MSGVNRLILQDIANKGAKGEEAMKMMSPEAIREEGTENMEKELTEKE